MASLENDRPRYFVAEDKAPAEPVRDLQTEVLRLTLAQLDPYAG